MRTKFIVLLLPVFVLCTPLTSLAQRYFSNVDRAAEAIEHSLKQVMPEWECHSIEPITPPGSIDSSAVSDKVKIQQWESGYKNVRIVLVRHQSDEESAVALRRFAEAQKTNNRVPGLGDEAYSYGIDGGLAFRTGNLVVFISAVIVKEINRAEGINTLGDAALAEHTETESATRGFAQRIAAVLSTF
jgi:hypothetical protein